ncbi:MAG: hypothetical protein A2857_00085 [Candidatus Levybacteria bacterium RIFCSPHIGHO2_01_FULL_36_15]|nr:MAG: hypothetical protein A2857_00085 [Candidatus Levybacteria bacterium RIFCSPHIGHO2_01_FULL_36_15]OGH36944.1 MAG: hypothetical protein A2905_01005 [Candidatus Levybacteria bacterium RIFCSPLOWO2_01_FULL_36_10]
MRAENRPGICPFNGHSCEPLSSGDADYFRIKTPQKDSLGRLVIAHAQELPYKCSSCFWEKGNEKLDKVCDRQDAQVVVLRVYPDDVTLPLYASLLDNSLGKYNVATADEQRWGDGELNLMLKGEAPSAQSVYIVTSIQNEADFMRAARVADHYKSDLNAKSVTLVTPFMASGRQDKNVNSQTGAYLPTTVNIRADIKAMASVFDRAIVWEPHSAATQYFAAEAEMPLLPLSPWKRMTDNMLEKGVRVDGRRVKITPENSVVIGPDKGRNLAATRIAEYLNMRYVSFNKTRISGSKTSVYKLTPEEQELIKGRIAVGYDDEGSTFGTANTIADPLEQYGATAFSLNLVHPKCTGAWVQNIRHPLLTTVFVSDSRQPVGNINMAGDIIEKVSLFSDVRDVIEADIKRVSFWEDEQRFRSMILQPYANKVA